MANLTWQELTQRNIDTIRAIFKDTALSQDMRLRAYDIAYKMIKDERFDSISGRWNAFHNALRIVVEGMTTV